MDEQGVRPVVQIFWVAHQNQHQLCCITALLYYSLTIQNGPYLFLRLSSLSANVGICVNLALTDNATNSFPAYRIFAISSHSALAKGWHWISYKGGRFPVVEEYLRCTFICISRASERGIIMDTDSTDLSSEQTYIVAQNYFNSLHLQKECP